MTDFFIADTHFSHKNILKFCNEHRPFKDIDEMDNVLIENWNNTVGPEDTVYVLGDYFLGGRNNHTQVAFITHALNGRKVLVQGNHDLHYTASRWLEMGFSKVVPMFEYRGCLLTHVPVDKGEIRGQSRRGRWLANIHGHLHDEGNSPEMNDTGRFCVSAECVDLTPISWDDLWTRICDSSMPYIRLDKAAFVQCTLAFTTDIAVFDNESLRRVKGKGSLTKICVGHIFPLVKASECGSFITIKDDNDYVTVKSKNFVGVE